MNQKEIDELKQWCIDTYDITPSRKWLMQAANILRNGDGNLYSFSLKIEDNIFYAHKDRATGAFKYAIGYTLDSSLDGYEYDGVIATDKIRAGSIAADKITFDPIEITQMIDAYKKSGYVSCDESEAVFKKFKKIAEKAHKQSKHSL